MSKHTGAAAPAGPIKNRKGKFEGTRRNTVECLLAGTLETSGQSIKVLNHGVEPPRSLTKKRSWQLKVVPDDPIGIFWVRAKDNVWRRIWEKSKMRAKATRAAEAVLEELKTMNK